MKLKFIPAIAVLTAVVFLYSACKKTENKPVPAKSTDYAALSSKIALTLAKGLTGGFGGANINDGIKAPSKLSTDNHKGPRLFSTNPFCGYTIDTTYNNSATAGDTTKTFKGSFRFTYNCTGDNVDGYTVHDSLTNIQEGTQFNNLSAVGQNYIVKALDNTYQYVSMIGDINTQVFNRVLTPAGATTEYHYLAAQYKLQDLKVRITNGVADIVSGTATFNMLRTDLDPTTAIDGNFYPYSGTITYLGNHKAKLTINGNPAQSYNVDLITGQATAI